MPLNGMPAAVVLMLLWCVIVEQAVPGFLRLFWTALTVMPGAIYALVF